MALVHFTKLCPTTYLGTPLLNCLPVTRILPPHPHEHVCPFASSFAAHAFASPRRAPDPLANTTVPSIRTFGPKVRGADQKLFNNATNVVLMRQGTRTVLSMQNNYQGPPENFAMVVPVPVVLQKENVKTLPTDIFDKIDQFSLWSANTKLSF